MKRVHPAFGSINRGDVSQHTLLEVLETYRRIESDWGTLASRIAIHSDTGNYVVRIVAKRLTLGLEGEPPAQAVPLEAGEIVKRIEQPPVPASIRPPPPPPEPAWRHALAVVLLVAGIALIIHALKPILVPDRGPPGDLVLVTDPAEQNARQRSLVGNFATGQRAGDRQILISANGFVQRSELGPRQRLVSGGDTFKIGQSKDQTCLVTPESGVVYVVDSNTLLYYGDTYRRLPEAQAVRR